MDTQNQPLMILLGGLLFVTLLVFSLSPSIQGSVARLLDSSAFVTLDDSVDTSSVEVEFGVVSRVVDGDTIVLEDGRDIRYLYIDTPETVKPGTPIQCYGPEASRLNKTLVESREVALVKDVQNEDRYGRDLRIVYLKGVDYTNVSLSVNAQMVKNGFARASIYQPNDTYADQFLEWESQAKSDLQGLWLLCDEE